MATIELSQGSYRGLERDGVHAFHAIPYAAPHKRFQSSKKITPSTTTSSSTPQDATTFGPIPPQLPSRLEFVMGPMPADTGPQDEAKCGVLSVYRPKDAGDGDLLPVIVWMHGGAFVSGGSQIPWYDGSRLARDGKMIVVCINYRLGACGFLYDEQRGVEGLKLPVGCEDVVLAFEWVRDNIGAFGGDAKNVTAYGQSAGGIHIQVLLDHRPDLFIKAILQSSPAGRTLPAEKAKAIRQSVIDSLPPSTTLDTAPIQDLLQAQAKALRAHADHMGPFMPSTNTTTIPGYSRTSTSHGKKHILIGWTKTDGACFAALGLLNTGLPAYMVPPIAYEMGGAVTRSIFAAPSKKLANHLRKEGHAVTTFVLDWEPEGWELGATHCSDLPLVFGDEEAWKRAPMLGDVGWEEWERRGKALRQAWGRFARDGSLPPPSLDGVTVCDAS